MAEGPKPKQKAGYNPVQMPGPQFYFKRAIANGYSKSPRGIMNAFREVQTLLKQIRVAAHNEVVVRASDQIEVLCRGYMSPDPLGRLPAWLKPQLSRHEADFLCFLAEREGRVVSKAAMMDALYFDARNEPEPKILDVFACRLRKKLEDSGYKIETVWGIGWRLVKSSDASGESPAMLRRRFFEENKAAALATADRMMAA